MDGLKWWCIGLCCIAPVWCYHQTQDYSIDASRKRMAPPSELIVSGVSSPSEQSINKTIEPGESTYKKFCQVCHAAGIAGAPKMGSHDQWMERYKDGWPVMMKRAMNGYKGMPAKGHCMKCSEKDIHEAIEYMLNHSGIESES